MCTCAVPSPFDPAPVPARKGPRHAAPEDATEPAESVPAVPSVPVPTPAPVAVPERRRPLVAGKMVAFCIGLALGGFLLSVARDAEPVAEPAPVAVESIEPAPVPRDVPLGVSFVEWCAESRDGRVCIHRATPDGPVKAYPSWDTVGTADGVKLDPCPTEDSITRCVWIADERGNGKGQSFIVV